MNHKSVEAIRESPLHLGLTPAILPQETSDAAAFKEFLETTEPI
ncbi:hypothetical protein [Phormidium pseudopriestleyi]|nr:hypothetical protein [Phormidium pseudopriestleyi]